MHTTVTNIPVRAVRFASPSVSLCLSLCETQQQQQGPSQNSWVTLSSSLIFKKKVFYTFFPTLFHLFSLLTFIYFSFRKKKGKERGGIGVPIFTCPGCVLLLFLYRSVYLNGHMDRHTSKHTRIVYHFLCSI